MSLINVSLNVVSYADTPVSVNPQVKHADYAWSLLGFPTDNPKQVPINLAPGESATVMSTARSISFTGATSFEIAQVAATTNAQLIGAYGARTARADGDATTEWAITKSNKLIRMTHTGTGTAPTFGGMSAGDGLTLGTGFSALNQGDYTIVKVGVDFVEFEHESGVAETIAAQAEIYSSGPVQVGDTLDLTDTAFAFPNRGQFIITRVTDALVEFSNPDAVPESGITGVVATGLVIYPDVFKWMLMAVEHRVVVKLNGDTGSGVEVEPPSEGDLVETPGLFLKRGKVYQVDIENPGLTTAEGLVFLAE